MVATAVSRGGGGASCVWKAIVSPPVARGEVVSRSGGGTGAERSPGDRYRRSGNRSGSGISRGRRAKENLRGRRLQWEVNENFLSFVGMSSTKNR